MNPVDRLAELRRTRPRSRFMRISLLALAALGLYSWSSDLIEVGDAFSARRAANLERFLSREVVPFPLRDDPEAGFSDFVAWANGVMVERGYEAAAATVAISVLAIVLAGILSWLGTPFAAANVASRHPFDADPRTPERETGAWRYVRVATRAGMVMLRSIPEYVLAFLFLAVLGPGTAWPAVLALALHNGGILGRLSAETVENLEPGPLQGLRVIGARRAGVLAAGVFPLALGRYLLYFFYRFETCVREATVLGMLGVVSLGYWIQDARGRHFYDEMILLVAVGSVIVLAADLASALARRYVREGRVR